MPMMIYHDISEIEERLSHNDEIYIFAGFGGGSEAFIDDAFDNGEPHVRIPIRVADGDQSLDDYVRRGIMTAERTPVFVVPSELSSDIEDRLDASRRARMASAQGQIPDVLHFLSTMGRDVYVQSKAPVYRVRNATEINGLWIRNDDGGTVVEVGNPAPGVDFYTAYLDRIPDSVSARQHPNFRTLSPLPHAARELAKLTVKEMKKRPDVGSIKDFFVVVAYTDSVGNRGTLDVVDDATIAMLVAEFNAIADENPSISFEALVIVGDVQERRSKIAETAKKYEGSIKKVFERSVAIRDASFEVAEKERDSWNLLERSFPKSKINKIDFTFVDTEETAKFGKVRVRNLPELSSPKKYLRMVTDAGQKSAITNAVNYLVNKNRDRTEKATTRSRTALTRFASSLVSHDYTKDERAEKAVASIVGRYPLDEGHDIVITDDPVALFSKATGQDWEQESCEKDGGTHNEGVYSDIEIGNCIAFIVEKATEHPVARIMVRWCEDTGKDGKIGFGIERRWYHTTVPGKGAKVENASKTLLYQKMPALKATAALAKILKGKGVYDYDYCDTPYRYGGYSDVMQGSNKNISYENLYAKYGRLFSLFTEGFKVDFSNIDIAELDAFLSIDPTILDGMSDDDFLFVVTAIALSGNADMVISVSGNIFANLVDISRTKLLANALIDKNFFRYLKPAFDALDGQVRKVFFDFLNTGDHDGLTSILVDPVYAKFPFLVAGVIGSMAMSDEGKETFKKIPPCAILGNDSPVVLMSALAFFESIEDDASFEKCADKLSSMFDIYDLKSLVSEHDRRLRDKGTSTCVENQYKFIKQAGVSNDLAFCTHLATDKFFITSDPMSRSFKIRICVVVEQHYSYPSVPPGFRYPFDDNYLLEKFKRDYDPRVVKAAHHLYRYYKSKGADDKLAQYPPG